MAINTAENFNANEMCCDCHRMDKKIKKICKDYCKGGKDGITPHIGENGNWWIGDADTGIHAQGEPGDTANIKALQMQMEGYAGAGIDVLRYDKIIFDNMDGAVYFAELSAFVVTKPGVYKIDWQVSYNAYGITLENGLIINLYVHNVNYAQTMANFSGAAYGQMCGSAVFNIEDFGELPLTFHLRCETEENVKYSDVPVQSNIVVTKLN